ncbi:MAG TPA: hypothetical protein ENF23_00485 [Methanosarcinales archaeon]|nr:MAG: hypothetical protein DRO03_09390 [Methanosarcinales archaeon]HDN64770.1 hypothetical protein [Methanosarcinales archaeon]
MKRLQHAQPPTPEKSKKSSRDYDGPVGRPPLNHPEMLADAQRPAHRYHIHYREPTVVTASAALLILALLVSLPLFALFAASSATPQQHEPIAVLMSDIIAEGVANKSDYTIFTKRPEDVYVCTHISCRQAEWIADNYDGYKTGVVMLWSNVKDSHARTWVKIGNETYVIESINDQYWTKDEHERIFSDQFEIEFVTTAQGWIHANESSEAFSNQTGGENR